MKNQSKYILGGGITGLIFAFYNREYTIISQDLGGRLNKEFFKNIIYLHHTPETEKFLNDVGIAYEKRTQIIKYCKNDLLTTDLTLNDKIQAIRKKLDDKEFSPQDLNLSTADYYISILEFNYRELIDKISDSVRFINDSIIRITESELITEKTSFAYESLVSTIPANIFWKLYACDDIPELKSKEVTFVLADKEPDFCKNTNYDMVYCIDDSQKYTRISKKPGERESLNILYEFTGNHTKESLIEFLPKDANILEHYVDRQGIIYTNRNNLPPKNVLFVGRFATWSHSDKQQDVIKQALFNYDLRHIFNRQSNFTKFHIDFNRLNSLEYREELTKDYLLHLIKETTEVLDEINYKHHKKQRKKVNEAKVKEELIDCFKFLLNIMLIWGVNADEFVEIFNTKSSFVEQLLKKEFEK